MTEQSSDKRSVSTDALQTLGTIIDSSAGRDAIHLAVYPVKAAHFMLPGDDAGLLTDGRASRNSEHLGIVDPFLKRGVAENEWFWLVVYPRQISSLRHVWEHPKFPSSIEPTTDQKSRELSIKFIERVAGEVGISYSELLNTITEHLDTCLDDSTICFGNEIDSREVSAEFWDHFEVITGRKIDRTWAGNVYFRCAC